jgi:hypothetical protein
MWKNAAMPEEQVEHYLHRATDMFDAMILLQEDRAFWNSSALLAIHSAISYSDALRVGLGDKKLSADGHERAADTLHSLLGSQYSENRDGLKHLRFLLSRKSVVAYSAKRLEYSDYQSLFTRAERFAQWADMAARQLKISGWKHDER